MEKSADAFRTISEVADELRVPQHVLRFWETRFPQIRPLKRAGGRRYYRPADTILLRAIRQLLYEEGYTIKGVQRLLKEQGARRLGAGTDPSANGYAEIAPDPAATTADPSSRIEPRFEPEFAARDGDAARLSSDVAEDGPGSSPARSRDLATGLIAGLAAEVLALVDDCLGIIQTVR